MISLAENCDESGLEWVLVSYDGVNSAWMRLAATTEPSVLQEHANLIAKLEDYDGIPNLPSRASKAGDMVYRIDPDGGYWGDSGYQYQHAAVPASHRYGANTDGPVSPPATNIVPASEDAGNGWWGDFGYTPASDRNGIANEAMRQAMTQKPAEPEPKPQAPDGVFEVAPMGRNPRGWGI